MLFWVGITDDDWFIHLSRMHPQPDEVNFGHFVRFTVLPCFIAWEAFGEKNGVTSLQELILQKASETGVDREIMEY